MNNFNLFNTMEEVKLYASESDNDLEKSPTTATENFADNRSSSIGNGIGSVFSPLAPPFQSRINRDLASMVTQQEPQVGDTAPSVAEIDMTNLRISDSDSTLFEDSSTTKSTRNYFMGSGAESVASTSGNIWSDNSSSKTKEMFDNFEFFLKTLSSANTYASMLTREQTSVLQSIRPALLFEFLQEVVRIRSEKRMQRALSNECAFCKNNGENEEHYSSHALKDWKGRVQCPVLRAFRCPRCGATGDRAHTIKYCPINDNGKNEEHYSSHALKDWKGRVQCPVLRAFRCPRCGATGDHAHTIKYCQINNGMEQRAGSALRRRQAPSAFGLQGSRAGYGEPPTPTSPVHPASPSANSVFNNVSFWSNFGAN